MPRPPKYPSNSIQFEFVTLLRTVQTGGIVTTFNQQQKNDERQKTKNKFYGPFSKERENKLHSVKFVAAQSRSRGVKASYLDDGNKLNLLFSDVLDAVVVVVFSSSLINREFKKTTPATATSLTKDLIRRTMAANVRYKSRFSSQSLYSVEQHREITRFSVVCKTCTTTADFF